MGNSSSSSSFNKHRRYSNHGSGGLSSSSGKSASGPPSAPGKPYLVVASPADEPDVITVKWKPPADNGGSNITGYIVEHRRTISPHWVKAVPGKIDKHYLTLSGLEPGCRYQFRVKAVNSLGHSPPSVVSDPVTMTVHRTAIVAPVFISGIEDRVALENDQVKFHVKFEGTPTPKISWYKDGFELFSNRRQRVNTDNGVSTLYIHQAEYADEGEIKCSATNRAGHAITKARLRLEAPPMVRLPQDYEEGLLLEQNEPMRLKVSVSGRPLPQVTWFHDGEEIRGGDRFEVIHTDKYAALKLACVKRSDRGCYQIQAVNALGDHTASFLVTVTDRPSPPGKVHVSKTSGKSVTLSWKAPEDDGGCKIGNFIIEYNRVGWDMWLKATTSRQLKADLDDLLEGSEYRFRVKAENPYGISIPSDVSEPIFLPDIKRGIFKQTNTIPLLFEDEEKLVKTKETNMLEFFGRKSKSPEPSTKPRKISVDEVSPPVPKRRKKKSKDDINNSETDIYRSMSFLNVSTENCQQPIEQKDHWGLPPGLKTNNGRTSPRDSLNSQNTPVLDYKAKRNSTESLLKLNFERESAPPISLSSPELGPESDVFEEHIRNSYSSSELLYERNLSRFNGYKNDEKLSSEAQKIAIYAMDRKNSLRRSPITRRSNDGSEEKSVFSDSGSFQSVIEASKRIKNASSFMSLENSIESLENTGREIIDNKNDDVENDNAPFTVYDSMVSGISKDSDDGYLLEYNVDGEFINFGSEKRVLQEQKASTAFFSTVYYDDDYLSDQKSSDRERSTSPAALREIEKSDEMSQDSLNSESTSSGEYSQGQQIKNKTDTSTEICTMVESKINDPQNYRPRDGIPKYVMLPNPFYKESERSMKTMEVSEGLPSHNRVKFELSSNSEEIVPPEIPRRMSDDGDNSHLALPVITVTETKDHSPKSVLKKIFLPEFADQNDSYYDRYNNVNSNAFDTLKQRPSECKDDNNRVTEVLQEDATMVVVKHYGDILERYSGVAKKPSSKTYLDFEQLKMAAIESESPVVLVDIQSTNKGQDDGDEDETESSEIQYQEEEQEYGREQLLDGDLDNPVMDVSEDQSTSMMLQDPTSATNAIPYLKIFGNLSLALFGYWLYAYKNEKLSVPVFGFLLVRFFKTQVWDRI